MATINLAQDRTYGEKLVEKLLTKLSGKRFFTQVEPVLYDERGTEAKPDFITILRDHGVAVIEVKDWVEITDCDKGNDTVTIKRRDGVEVVKANPFSQARRHAYFLTDMYEARKELLKTHKGELKLSFPWQAVVILPNISDTVIQQLVDKGFWGANTVIGKEDLDNAEALAQKLKKAPWLFSMKKPLSKRIIDMMMEVIEPSPGSTDVLPTKEQGDLIKEPLKKVNVTQMKLLADDDMLSEEAEQVIASTTVRLVRGVAGSGKTLVLVRRALFLRENYPDLKLCVLTFNKDLAHNLRQQIPDTNIDVLNFHKLCSQIIGKSWKSPSPIRGWIEHHASDKCRAMGFTVDFVAEEIGWRKDIDLFDNEEYLTIPRRGRGSALTQDKRRGINQIFDLYRAWQYERGQSHHPMSGADWEDVPYVTADILESQPESAKYDVILLDEAQDFAPSWISVIQLLLKDTGTLFICDDPTQSLFRYFSWKEKGVDVRGYTRVLRVPFRCTKQISIAAHSLLADDPVLSKSQDVTKPNFKTYELHEGPEPSLFAVKDVNAEVRLIEDRICQLMADGIETHEIAILCHHRKTIRHYASLRNQGCYVESFDKMKGLEFKAVFLPHLHNVFERSRNPGDSETATDTRRRVYTAMTRARAHLIMSYHSDIPEELSPLEPHVYRERLS